MLLLPVLGCAATARAATLHSPKSLPDELDRALQRRRPLLVMASLDGCPFCKLVRDSFLAPLQAENGQPIVQLDMGSRAMLEGFDGQATTHDQLLRAWKVTVAPTVLFFGRGGREVAQRLVGASIPDFYGAYLEERLQTALKSL
jgi:thioredoxin-related protein